MYQQEVLDSRGNPTIEAEVLHRKDVGSRYGSFLVK